eukprot:GHRR01005735.1.p1 GENE.GHRR01005735.1~~GHRR01005735.1.p1  ORF type:complete len:405 (+),score=150.85 GHRR01005735.1:874-2088(+)
MLLLQDTPRGMTVYTIRLSTSYDRGAALSEPYAGVNVCLVGKNGSAILHRILPVNDPEGNRRAMEQVCDVAGADTGADCSALSSRDKEPSWPGGKRPQVKPRFQEGSVDEVSFLAPELGSLAAIMLAPEGGTWMCNEVDVFSSRTKHSDRFVCRQRLGGRKGDPAVYLTPVPPNAVVYGTGDAARIITKEQAAALRAISLADYGGLKARLLLITSLLTVGGSGVAAAAAGTDAAVPFAIGGMAGLVYQLLLQLGVDAAVSNVSAAASSSTAAAVSAYSAAAARSSSGGSGNIKAGSAAGPFLGGSTNIDEPAGIQDRMLNLAGSPALRLGLLTAAALAAVWAIQDPSSPHYTLDVLHHRVSQTEAWQLGLGLCGFMMYKVAVLGVSLAPDVHKKVPQPAQRLEK